MIRLFLRLLGIKDYEVCQSCETLKAQLVFVNDEKRQLTETLLAIVHPKVIEQPIVEMNPVVQTSGIFSRRRAALEAKDREEAKILKEAKHLGKPDSLRDVHIASTSELEKELGIEEKAQGE